MNIKKDLNAKSLTYFSTENLMNLDEIIIFLKEQLENEPIVRVCLHKNKDELTHVMVIALKKDHTVDWHKNITKNKIYIILEGELEFAIDKKIILKQGDIFNLPKDTFAKQKAVSEVAIYLEMVAGPFKEGDTIYAD